MTIGDSDVLLVIDVQNDFCPGGNLAVPEGDKVVPVINALARRFQHVVATQDWHPAGHHSFASSHAGTQALRDRRGRVRPADPVARPLRAGHGRRRVPSPTWRCRTCSW